MKELKVREVKSFVVVCPWQTIDEPKPIYVNQGQCKTCDYCAEYKAKEFVKCIFDDQVIRIKSVGDHNGR